MLDDVTDALVVCNELLRKGLILDRVDHFHPYRQAAFYFHQCLAYELPSVNGLQHGFQLVLVDEDLVFQLIADEVKLLLGAFEVLHDLIREPKLIKLLQLLSQELNSPLVLLFGV